MSFPSRALATNWPFMIPSPLRGSGLLFAMLPQDCACGLSWAILRRPYGAVSAG